MRWISVKDALPNEGEKVLVWIRYEGETEFEWNDSEIDPYGHKHGGYVEPNTKLCWFMGSARNFEITHWAKITQPVD